MIEMKFLKNVWGIFCNTPLILSDTYDPKDISPNRVMTLLMAVNLIALSWYIAINPKEVSSLSTLWTGLLGYLGVQTGIVNTVKKGIDAYKVTRSSNTSSTKIGDDLNDKRAVS